MLGMRFIAINDHVDSILIPLKNLLNNSYSRDSSIKVRSAMTAKRNRAMEHVVVKKKNGKGYVNYRCHTCTAYSHDACTKHTIPEHEIHEAVLHTIKQYARMLMDFETVLKELYYKKHCRCQADSIDKELVQLQKEMDGIGQIKLGLYTDRTDIAARRGTSDP